MISQKAIQLVKTLYRMTMADLLKWGATVDEGVFQLSYPNFSIKIFEREEGSEIDFVVQVFNEDATLIDEITDVDVSNSEGFDPGEGFRFLKELYSKARSQALGVEDVMNNILEQLKSSDPSSDSDDAIPF